METQGKNVGQGKGNWSEEWGRGAGCRIEKMKFGQRLEVGRE